MKKIAKILISTALVFTFSCNQHSDNFDNSVLLDNHYENEYFGLDITFSDGWKAQDESVNEKLIVDCTELIANGVERVKTNILNEMQDNAVLLNLRSVNDTSSIVVFAEKETGFFWNPTNMETYLLQVKSLLDHTPLDYVYLNDTESKLTNWSLIETKFQLKDRTVYQDYYIQKKNGYFISLISTFQTEKQKQLNRQLVEKVKL
jgi:hypothetical protein